MDAPALDVRTFNDLMGELTRLAQGFAPEWAARGVEEPGKGLAAIYVHYLEVLLERLNRVPQKNLLAFLDLLGVSRLPPSPARLPLVFTLAAGAASGFVPAGTQAATVQTATKPAVVFETEEDLNVVAARLAAGLVVEPARDRYADATPAVTGQDGLILAPFEGDQPIDHILYVGSNPLLPQQIPGRLLLTFRPQAPAPAMQELQDLLGAVSWETFRGGSWQPLPPPKVTSTATEFKLDFPNFEGSEESELSGPGLPSPVRGRWVRARLSRPFEKVPGAAALLLESVQARVNVPLSGLNALLFDEPVITDLRPANLRPDQVHVNGTPIDFSRDFHPLGEHPRLGSTFYVSSREAFSKVEPGLPAEERGRVGLQFDLVVSDVVLTWEYAGRVEDKPAWKHLAVSDLTAGLAKDGLVILTPDTTPATLRVPVTPTDFVSVFLFRVTIRSGTYYRVPCLRAFQVILERTDGANNQQTTPAVAYTSETPQEPDTLTGTTTVLFARPSGLTPVDLHSPFFPFGTSPAEGNTFYFGIVPDQHSPNPQGDLVQVVRPNVRLSWEYLGREGWRRLGESSALSPSLEPKEHDFSDGTFAFSSTEFAGVVLSFRRPADFVEGMVNGQAGYWIRARLTGGAYGRPTEFVPLDPFDLKLGFRLRPLTGVLNAPLVRPPLLGYTAREPFPSVLTQTLLSLKDRTAANSQEGVSYQAFEPVPEKEPTFYLGFDRALPGEAVRLYLAASPRQFVEVLTPGEGTPGEARPSLAWEYWNGRDWAGLLVVDDTQGLSSSGSVQFLGPADLAPLALLGPGTAFWVRARQLEAAEGPSPRLAGVWLNAIPAVQAVTVRDEVLGSSSGQKDQAFRLGKAPVLPGQQVLVREPESPPGGEQELILSEEGADALQPREEAGGRTWWVRWHEVASLNGSGPRRRHYTLDRITGTVRFGDGLHGMIPPPGKDNVVCGFYRSGGGSGGNQPVGAVAQLKTSLPYVRAVSNPVGANGGMDAESLDEVLQRGPQLLRHRGRAVTAEDFEWLARQAAGARVDRACCLPNRNRELLPEAGWVTVVVLPCGPERKPLPSAEMVETLERDLAGRCLATLAGQSPVRVNVIGAGYVPVEVTATFRPVSLPRAEAARRVVRAALDRFLHPLTGGPEGTGWEFGRDVYLSELFAAFEALPDVEHVHSLAFRPTIAVLPLTFASSSKGAALPQADDAYPAGSLLTTDDGELAGVLVEPIAAGATVTSGMVVVFQEGERVRVGGEEGIEVTVRSISNNTLTVDPFLAQTEFPVGTTVASSAGGGRSVLAVALARGTRVSELSVRGFRPDEAVRLTLADETQPLVLSLAGRREAGGRVLSLGSRLRVPAFCLAYSGSHSVSVTAD